MSPHVIGAWDHMSPSPRLPLLRYGLLGTPLAFAALPVYVFWPALANTRWGLSLAGLGGLLVAVRVVDAAFDPLVGRMVDRWFDRGFPAAVAAMAAGGTLMLMGLGFLFVHEPASRNASAATWSCAAGALLVTSIGYSIAQITHQAWGARLASPQSPGATWIAAREVAALIGVLAASALPSLLGWAATLAVLGLWWTGSLLVVRTGPRPPRARDMLADGLDRDERRVDGAFRRLLAVHALNGIASAVPATLMTFYVADVLAAHQHLPGLLVTYFLSAGATAPLWTGAIRRWGGWRCWGIAIAMALGAFALVGSLGPGDVVAFFGVCVVTGMAFGGETIASQSCLVQQAGHGGGALDGGARFGWWALVSKLNLALAAGLALPLLGAAGYEPGMGKALQALVLAYAVLPSALKLLALVLWWHVRRAIANSPSRS